MVQANRLSVRQALQEQNAEKRKASSDAIEAEIKQLMDIGAFRPIRVEDLSEQERKRIIPSHMFLKEKLLANGDFDRMKARLVAGGNFVDARSVGETNAPTVNPLTVFFMLNVAAQYGLEILTADIKGAYLIPNIAEGSEPNTYVWIEKSLSEMFVKLYPNLRSYVYHNGKLVFKLRKYLYGRPQAAFHFHQHLSGSMKTLGFIQLISDRCAWRRGAGNEQLYVCAHVDDLLAIGKPEALSQFDKDIESIPQLATKKCIAILPSEDLRYEILAKRIWNLRMCGKAIMILQPERVTQWRKNHSLFKRIHLRGADLAFSGTSEYSLGLFHKRTLRSFHEARIIAMWLTPQIYDVNSALFKKDMAIRLNVIQSLKTPPNDL
jgi:hypothetical protein